MQKMIDMYSITNNKERGLRLKGQDDFLSSTEYKRTTVHQNN